jgi:transcriptional regulator with GAF, ATPase, and Fis domain
MAVSQIPKEKLLDLIEISTLVNSRLDIHHTLRTITLSAIGLIQADSAEIWLEKRIKATASAGRFQLVEATGLSSPILKREKAQDLARFLNEDASWEISGEKARDNSLLLKAGKAETALKNFFLQGGYHAGPLQSLFFQLNTRSGIKGIFSLSRKKGEKPFTADEIFLMEKLMQSTVNALNSNILLEILKKDLTQEREKNWQGNKIIPGIIGQSPNIIALKQLLTQIAPSELNILIQGERGTGKELVAENLRQLSRRKNSPFVKIHCAGMVDTLLESELFGHEKGSFTGAVSQKKGLFELAHNGTLFLDEIGEMKEALQVKLLRILQEGKFRRVGGEREIRVDVRILAATNREVDQDLSGRILRRDLFDRLAGMVVRIPPLRERREDILTLAVHFLKKFSLLENRLAVQSISRELSQFMLDYAWPGNVRELENMVHRLLILSEGNQLQWIKHASLDTFRAEALAHKVPSPDNRVETLSENAYHYSLDDEFKKIKNDFEKDYLIHLLSKCRANLSQMARISGLDRNNLKLKMKKYKLPRKDYL